MDRSGYRVLIVGCGEIGSRHLQAVASLPIVREVEVVDPRPEGLELGRRRLTEVPDRSLSTVFCWLSSLEEASKGGDLCIVTTQADKRCQLVYQVVDALGYSCFLLEKFVAQSVRDYEELLGFSREKSLSVWVNCKTRAYPFHQRVKRCLNPSDPVLFNVVGGNFGLASNGVHAADLFAYYDGTDCVESAGSKVDPILHPSKRGNGMFDLSGTLHGYTRKGSHFILSYACDHNGSEHISIETRGYRCIVDHFQRWAWESDVATGWKWRSVPFEGNLMISNMTKVFAADILTRGNCELPTLAECFPAHRFILSEMQPYFRQLLGREMELCPVT